MSEEKPKMPKVNKDIDWKAVIEYATYGCNELEAGREVPDFEHLLVMNVLEAIYGPYVWAWILACPLGLVEGKTTEILEGSDNGTPSTHLSHPR